MSDKPLVQFLNLKQINNRFEAELNEKFRQVLSSGWYIRGQEVTAFERKYANYCGTEFCVGVGNGLDALNLTIRAWKELGKLREGDEVIVQGNTYIATILAIIENKLVPIVVEPDKGTYNLAPENVEKAITCKTKLIIPVHLYGRISPMHEICEISKKYGLLILEDAAQAHGSELSGKRAGSWGDAAAFSFYPGKNLGCLGDGGAVTTNDQKLADMIRVISNYGSERKYINNVTGINSRLDELQAGILNIKLGGLNADNEARRRVAHRYLSEISNENLILPFHPFKTEISKQHVWHLFVVRVKNRERFINHLSNHGVEYLIHYPISPQQQIALRDYFQTNCKTSARLSNEVISLPISPVMSDYEVNLVIDACNSFN